MASPKLHAANALENGHERRFSGVSKCSGMVKRPDERGHQTPTCITIHIIVDVHHDPHHQTLYQVDGYAHAKFVCTVHMHTSCSPDEHSSFGSGCARTVHLCRCQWQGGGDEIFGTCTGTCPKQGRTQPMHLALGSFLVMVKIYVEDLVSTPGVLTRRSEIPV
jgi:hypothetical protein